jgi:ribose transport system permease protein
MTVDGYQPTEKATPDAAQTSTREAPAPAPVEERPRRADLIGRLRLDRYSGVILCVDLAVAFTLWLPDSFGTVPNARVIAASAAITGLLTLGVVVALISGMFDLSLAANMTFTIALLGWLIGERGLQWPLAVGIALVAGALIGAGNAFIVTVMNVEPVIGTLGMSSILAAISFGVSNGRTVLFPEVSQTFNDMGTARIATVPITVFYLAAAAGVLWVVFEHTPFGRYLYAIGSNAGAARLAGIKVKRLQWSALIIAGMLASAAGVVLTMQLNASSFGAGASYLLPAFAAAFLGSTQIRPGRFNILGTIVALYLLAIAVKGLQLRFPDLPWIKDLVEGVVVIAAVALTARAAARRRSSA